MRLQSRCSKGRPQMGTSALPGRRVEAIRACTRIPTRPRLGTHGAAKRMPVLHHLVHGVCNIVHIGSRCREAHHSRKHHFAFVKPLGGRTRSTLITCTSPVILESKMPTVLIKRRQIEWTDITR